MPFCSNCGNKIEEQDKICRRCGKNLEENNNENKRQIVFDGTVHKCPNCGEILNSFVANCPTCGYELRTSRSSVAELSRKLEEIENNIDEKNDLEVMKLRAFWGTAAIGLPKSYEQKISLIKNFPIPNTKEDLYEFLILSKSNITYSSLPENDVRRLLSEAWKSKFEQAYLKAKLLFANDDIMTEINSMYQEINKKSKSGDLTFWIILLFIVVIPTIMIWLMLYLYMN